MALRWTFELPVWHKVARFPERGNYPRPENPSFAYPIADVHAHTRSEAETGYAQRRTRFISANKEMHQLNAQHPREVHQNI